MFKIEKCGRPLRVVEALRLVVCALHLAITFLVLSFKKRSPWQAILLLASTGMTMSVLMMPEERLEGRLSRRAKKGAGSESAEEENETPAEEIFTEEESAEAEARVRETLSGNGEEETAPTPSARREIPRDEEASEADFQ